MLLGGDGTVRVASKVSGDTPLLPVSTGTNNVIPYLVDGTVAGLAAGVLAESLINPFSVSYRLKRIKLYINGRLIDRGIVDVASTQYPFIGSRAIMDLGLVKNAVVVHAPLTSIGLASIAAMLRPLSPEDERALYFRLGGGRLRVKAIVAPGVVEEVKVKEVKEVRLGEEVRLEDAMTVELDGEREFQVLEDSRVTAVPSGDGPYIVDIRKVLSLASSEGVFVRGKSAEKLNIGLLERIIGEKP